jgi:hypothetical protein
MLIMPSLTLIACEHPLSDMRHTVDTVKSYMEFCGLDGGYLVQERDRVKFGGAKGWIHK